jgi:hypothetical protein
MNSVAELPAKTVHRASRVVLEYENHLKGSLCLLGAKILNAQLELLATLVGGDYDGELEMH